jgi:hypothetical protein
VAQKLLDAPIIGGGSAQAEGGGGGGGGSQRSKKCPPPRAARTVRKWQLNGWFPALFGLEIAKNSVFRSKVLNKIYPKTFIEEYINFTIFCYLRHCGVIPVQILYAPRRPD